MKNRLIGAALVLAVCLPALILGGMIALYIALTLLIYR